MTEQLAILYEIQSISERLRGVGDTDVWEAAAQEFNPNMRSYIVELLEDIESSARTMRHTVSPPDGENYGVRR